MAAHARLKNAFTEDEKSHNHEMAHIISRRDVKDSRMRVSFISDLTHYTAAALQ